MSQRPPEDPHSAETQIGRPSDPGKPPPPPSGAPSGPPSGPPFAPPSGPPSAPPPGYGYGGQPSGAPSGWPPQQPGPGWQGGPPGGYGSGGPGGYQPSPGGPSKLPWIIAAAVLAIVLIGGTVTAFVLANGDDDDEKAGDPNTSSSAPDPTSEPTDAEPAPATSPPAPTSPAPSSPEPSSPEPVDPAGPSLEAMEIGGSWSGTYTCPQGPTKLTLTMASLGEGDGVQAVFEFGPTASGPAVPDGAFLMEGTIADGVLDLDGTEWLNQPDGYGFVGLRADVPDATVDTLTGAVTDGGCSTFKISR